MSNKSEVYKEIYLEDLPKRKGKTNQINWLKSIGYKVKFIYDDIEGEMEILNYDSKSKIITLSYDNKEVSMSVVVFSRGQLGKVLDKRTIKFKLEIGQVFKDDKRDMTIIDREYRLKKGNNQKSKYYKYKCNKCGWTEGWILESNLLKGIGCGCCSPFLKKSVEGINDIPTTAPWMIPYFQGGYDEAKMYTKTSGQKIYPICPDCGRIKTSPMIIAHIHDRKSINCSCGDGMSYPEKFMYGILEQMGINFQTEYSPEWIKPKRYDFYFELGNNKYIVEMDGGFHNQYNNRSGQTAKDSKDIDNYKDKVAKEQRIEVIRINSEESNLEYIKNNILNSQLVEIFSFNNINWYKIEGFALSNRVKEACRLKQNNPNITAKEIGEVMKVSNSTIINYLKRGAKLGWCNYEVEKEKNKGTQKFVAITKQMNSKPVEIFKDEISLGVFRSATELAKQSEELLGVKLIISGISAVCLGKKSQYKGFVFAYK